MNSEEAKAQIEELKKQFKVANIPGRGRCIIIPLSKFKPEWDQTILDAGLESHGGENAVFVHLRYEEVHAEKAGAKRRSIRGDQWTADEDTLLIEWWNRTPRLTRSAIAKKIEKIYPQRSLAAVENRLSRLRTKGKIKSRFQRGAPKKTVAPGTASSFPALSSTGQLLANITETLSHIVQVLGEHTTILDKQELCILMHVLELKQKKGELTIPPSLWVHYVNALLEHDLKLSDVFRNKVKQLLAASQ